MHALCSQSHVSYSNKSTPSSCMCQPCFGDRHRVANAKHKLAICINEERPHGATGGLVWAFICVCLDLHARVLVSGRNNNNLRSRRHNSQTNPIDWAWDSKRHPIQRQIDCSHQRCFQKDAHGHLVYNIEHPRVVEIRSREQTSFSQKYHEGSACDTPPQIDFLIRNKPL